MDFAHHQKKGCRILHAAGILPVITVDSIDQARRIAEAMLRGGLHTLELTLRTAAALDALSALKKEMPDILIGAGTVLEAGQILQAMDAGADFLVTPGTPPDLAAALALAPLPTVPGAATPTELMALRARGFAICKLFPASAVGGVSAVKALSGPLAGLALCPTGGIGEADAAGYLAQANVACVGGSWMVPRAWIDAGDWARVRAAAARAAAMVRAARA